MIKRMIFHENYWNPNWNPYFKVTLTLTHFLFLCNPYILRQKIVYCQREDRIFSTFEDRVFSPTVYFTPRTVYIQLYDRIFSGVKAVYFQSGAYILRETLQIVYFRVFSLKIVSHQLYQPCMYQKR